MLKLVGGRAKPAEVKAHHSWVPWVRTLMAATLETEVEEKLHHHYPHTDPSKHLRWTAKECYEYLYDKPWAPVNDFYSALVNGRCALSDLIGVKVGEFRMDFYCCPSDVLILCLKQGCIGGDLVGISDEYAPESTLPEDRSSRWARVTYKIVVSYHGAYFGGWQKQPGLHTVQGLVERSIGTFVDDRKAQQLKDKGLPVEGMAVVAGRTDKGVTALNQVCSFYTWRNDVKVEDIEHAINTAAPGKLRVVSVSQVSRAFHPNFCAKWRRYLYILPISGDSQDQFNGRGKVNLCFSNIQGWEEKETAEDRVEVETDSSNGNLVTGVKKPTGFSISKVDQLLRHLEGKLLSYKMFARDTKASRNVGPATECFVYQARAIEARLPCSIKDHGKVMCIELIANRFLRRMVRVLVATAVREAAACSKDDVLLKLMEATCRRATAPPAPPDGLCLVDVGYTDFDPQKCFIR